MLQSDRDRSLVEHLATKVMGLSVTKTKVSVSPTPRYIWRITLNGRRLALMPGEWWPLDSWADAGTVWEQAAKMGVYLRLNLIPPMLTWSVEVLSGDNWTYPPITVTDDASGHRAICEAIALATGWEEPNRE